MAYGLPVHGQSDWSDELNNSVEAIKATADSASATAASALNTATSAATQASTAQAQAQVATDFVRANTDGQTESILTDLTSASRIALNDAIVDPLDTRITTLENAPQGGDSSWMSDLDDPWDGLTQSLAVQAGRDRLAALFASTGTRVAVGRRGTAYDLYQELSAGLWWRASLDLGTCHALLQSRIERPYVPVDELDASWVFAGTWTNSPNTNTYGGRYSQSSTTSDTATWTTPAGATVVGLIAPRLTNGGLGKVTLDGDATAATMLPTAQDVVDAGTFPNTILVANGGTLNPTDRVLDSYSSVNSFDLNAAVPYSHAILAEGLAPAVHTVVVTVTGYKRAASTDDRVYLSGGVYATATTTPATVGATPVVVADLLVDSSVYEYAISCRPPGGATTKFIGNRHSDDNETSFTVELDGAVIAPADGTITLGTTVTASRATDLTHPEVVGNVGAGTCSWTMTPTGGLDVHWTIDWLTAMESPNAYPAMLPTQGNTMTRARAAGGPVVTPLDDDGSAKGSTRSDTLVLWQDGGSRAVMATVRNLATAVNRWANALDRHAWVEDRIGGDFNKGYFQRAQAGAPVELIASGDTWESYITYRAGWLDDTSALEPV